MTDRIIHSEDDRTYRAWSYDSELYKNEAKRLASKNISENEKQRIRQDFRNKSSELGIKRQQSLYKSKVLIVGSDCLAQLVSSCVAGIGVGNIFLMDNKRVNEEDRNDFLCLKDYSYLGKKKVAVIAEALREINTHANIFPRHSKFNEVFAHELTPEIIIDATNDSY
ncbi:MAG: ThiF family adenylyltransferase, partial [Candidatus Nanoarchaeia archaeon]|nr:ThiF family adenylyltransferase [Candidatus Nanoarchaeia archaeon]